MLTKKTITVNDVLDFIYRANVEDLKVIKREVDYTIKSVSRAQATTLKPGDIVMFENKRSTKLPIGKVRGMVVKVNITRAKIQTDLGLWNVPFELLEKI